MKVRNSRNGIASRDESNSIKGTVSRDDFSAQTVPSCWDKKYLEVFEFGPLLTKVKHKLAHLALWKKALISIPRLLLQRLSSLRAFSYSA
jgi:hypothetical protein